MGGNPQQQSQQTTQTQLTPEQNQLLQLGMPFAQQYAANPPKLPEGSVVAGFNPLQQTAQGMALGAAGNQGKTAENATGAHSFLTTGAALDPNSNPGLRGAIDYATKPIERNLTENILPNLRSEATGAGGMGGSRGEIAQGIASRGTQEAVGGVSSQMANANYQNALDQMTRAMGLTPTVQQSQIAPAGTVGAVGDVNQNLTQQRLTEAFQKYMFPQEQPAAMAQQLYGWASGIPGGGTTTQGTNTQQMSPLQTAMGLGSLGAGLFGANGMFGAGASGGGAFADLLPMLMLA